MQSEFLYPKVADRTSLSEWEYRGAPEIIATAHKAVQKIMAQHYPDHIDPARDAALRDRFPIRLGAADMRPGNTRW